MAGSSDAQALLLQVSADTSRAIKQLDGLSKKLSGVATDSERASKKAGTSLERFFGKTDPGKALDKVFDSTRFKILDSGTARVGLFGSAIEALGPIGLTAAAGIGAFALAMDKARKTAQWADDLEAMAVKIGISAEELQKFNFAAMKADVDTEAADASLQGLNSTLGAFKSHVGDVRVKKAFEFLHIDASDLAGVHNASDLLPILAERLTHVQDKAERVKIAQALKIEDLLPLLEMGKDKIKGFGDQAEHLGLVMDGKTVTSMADMNKEMETADKRMEAAGHRMTASMVPAVTDLKNALADLVDKLAQAVEWWTRFEAHLSPMNASRDSQMIEQLHIADTANTRAAQARTGMAGAIAAGASGMEAMTAAGREHFASGQEAIAAAASARVEELSNAAAKAANALGAVAAPSAQPVTPFDPLGSGGGKKKKGGSEVFTGPDKSGFIAADNIGTVAALDGSEVDVIEAFRGLIKDIDQNPSLKDSIPELEQIGDRIVTKEEYQQLHDTLAENIRGGLEAGIRGGWPGLLEYIGQSLEKALLDAASSALASSVMSAGKGGGWVSTAFSYGAKILGFAGGGDPPVGVPSIVGERGPEIIVPKSPMTVIPNHALGRGGGQTVIQEFHLHAEGAIMTKDLMSGLQRQAENTRRAAVAEALTAARRGAPSFQRSYAKLGTT